MFVLSGTDGNGKCYITQIHGVYLRTGNRDRAIVFDDEAAALDILCYLDDLQLSGRFPRVEALCIEKI